MQHQELKAMQEPGRDSKTKHHVPTDSRMGHGLVEIQVCSSTEPYQNLISLFSTIKSFKQ